MFRIEDIIRDGIVLVPVKDKKNSENSHILNGKNPYFGGLDGLGFNG